MAGQAVDPDQKALTRGKLDRAALRRVKAAAMKSARREFAHVGKTLGEAASESVTATLASGAMAARIASGTLAGIADTLVDKTPRRTR